MDRRMRQWSPEEDDIYDDGVDSAILRDEREVPLHLVQNDPTPPGGTAVDPTPTGIVDPTPTGTDLEAAAEALLSDTPPPAPASHETPADVDEDDPHEKLLAALNARQSQRPSRVEEAADAYEEGYDMEQPQRRQPTAEEVPSEDDAAALVDSGDLSNLDPHWADDDGEDERSADSEADDAAGSRTPMRPIEVADDSDVMWAGNTLPAIQMPTVVRPGLVERYKAGAKVRQARRDAIAKQRNDELQRAEHEAMERRRALLAELNGEDAVRIKADIAAISTARATESRIESPRDLHLKLPRQLHDHARSLTVAELEGISQRQRNAGEDLSTVEHAQTVALHGLAMAAPTRRRRRVPLDEDLRREAHEAALSGARAMVISAINDANRRALGRVYENPFPRDQKTGAEIAHRRFAYDRLIEALHIGSEECDINKFDQFTLLTRLVVGQDGRYVVDSDRNGIGKVMEACGTTLENNDPEGRDLRLSGLVDKGERDTYEGGLGVEIRIAGFEVEDPDPSVLTAEEYQARLNNPWILCKAEIEPRAIKAETMTKLVLGQNKQIGGHGRAALVNPAHMYTTAAQAFKDIILPAAMTFAQEHKSVHNEGRELVEKRFREKGWSEADKGLRTPPLAALPSAAQFVKGERVNAITGAVENDKPEVETPAARPEVTAGSEATDAADETEAFNAGRKPVDPDAELIDAEFMDQE